MKDITKNDAKVALGFDTDAELARWFEIGRWAVGQWADHEPLPVARQWELRAKRPDLFPVKRGRNRATTASASASPTRVSSS